MEPGYTDKIKAVGQRIKQLRQEKALTQQALADLCEVDIRTIQRIEKGEFSFSISTLFALSDAFEIEPPILLQGI